MSLDTPCALHLRPARSTDAGKLGAMITEAVAAHAWKPHLRSGAEDIAFAGSMIDKGWITVAELGNAVAGFIARDGAEVHSLYVAGWAQGKGVGRVLIDTAKAGSGHLSLWTFQANHGAQRFYTREGFAAAEHTEGSSNEERLPDIRFTWSRRPGP